MSPIATLVILAGSTASLTTYAAAGAYASADTADYGLGSPTATPLRGVFSKVRKAGVEVKHKALFLISELVLPDGLKTGQSRLSVNGVDYVIAAADPRWYRGAADGFNLHLAL